MSVLTEMPREQYITDAFSGFSNTLDFNLGTARALMWLSQLAYEDPDSAKVGDILGSWGLERGPLLSQGELQIGLVKVQDTSAVVAIRHDAVLVAFRGTDPVKAAEWSDDFKLASDATGVHEGFEAAARAIFGEFKARLADPLLTIADRRWFFAGHSLGAAVAALAALQVDEANREVAAVYTFGMPRVGTGEFAMKYNARLGGCTYRLVNGSDVVPTVPPFDFRHVGRYLHSLDGRFADPKLITADPRRLPPERWCNEPQFQNTLLDVISRFRRDPGSGLRSFARSAGLSAARSASRLPHIGNQMNALFTSAVLPPLDLATVGEADLPLPIRDHIPRRYLDALEPD